MASIPAGLSARAAFEKAVEQERGRGTLQGALLVSRDGFPLAGEFPGLPNLDVFAAMHATALGAAEIALHGIGAERGVSLMAQIGGRRFISRAISDTMFVVALVEVDADCHVVSAWLDDLGRSLSS